MSTQYLTVSAGTLAYDDQGTGPLVLCVPGMGDLRAEYRFLAPRLVDAGYRVVTMDIRGHGETSANWPDYTVAATGSDMLALIKHLNAGPALIIGTSMAAAAAVWAAVETPELVAGIVLIGPFVRVMAPAWQSRLLANIVAAPLWGVAFWGWYYARLYPTARPADFADYLSKLKRNLKEPGHLHALRAMLSDTKAASDARLSQVQVPVHILMGTRDPDFKHPEQEVQLLVERLHATAQMIEGAGHYPHAEMPEQAVASILSFFQTIKERVSHGN
jgi:pimeloyl-ACP methyl ester carboxylesterase